MNYHFGETVLLRPQKIRVILVPLNIYALQRCFTDLCNVVLLFSDPFCYLKCFMCVFVLFVLCSLAITFIKLPFVYKNSEYDQEIQQSRTADKPLSTQGRATQQFTRHQEDKLSKATSSLFSIKMIAKLERT